MRDFVMEGLSRGIGWFAADDSRQDHPFRADAAP
jgi:hypothetical protein